MKYDPTTFEFNIELKNWINLMNDISPLIIQAVEEQFSQLSFILPETGSLITY